ETLPNWPFPSQVAGVFQGIELGRSPGARYCEPSVGAVAQATSARAPDAAMMAERTRASWMERFFFMEWETVHPADQRSNSVWPIMVHLCRTRNSPLLIRVARAFLGPPGTMDGKQENPARTGR